MFEALSEKLNGVFSRFTSKGRLTEKDVEEGLREVRLALLEADVNFKVARDFIQRVRERSVGTEVLESLSPGQQIVKIVHEEMTRILGGESSRLDIAPQPPTVVMLAGPSGFGQDHHGGKVGPQPQALRPAGATGGRRPSASRGHRAVGDPWSTTGSARVQRGGPTPTQSRCAARGCRRPKIWDVGWVILDTGGRLHIDDEMMGELGEVVKATSPTEVLLVVDAMTGQDGGAIGRGLPQRRRIDGPNCHQAGWRRTRRGGPVHIRGDRPAHQVHRDRREKRTPLNPSIRTAWHPASWEWATF